MTPTVNICCGMATRESRDRPDVEINARVGSGDLDLNDGGVIATAAKVVNAITAVCAAPPGLVSLRDLPIELVHGVMR